MSRLEKSFKIFSKQGVKFLMLEFLIVFLGVYLAFLFQSYSEQNKIDAETEKIMIGLKEDLEYFRIYFPDYAGSSQVEEWRELIKNEKYTNFSTWRFIQPQYDYIAIEYALGSDANVINFELNSAIAEIFQELKKLEHAELLLTEIAMKYQAIPSNLQNNEMVAFANQNNFLNFKRFTDRYADRAGIMHRIAEMSAKHLPMINDQFSEQELTEIELLLISKNITANSDQEIQFYVNALKEFFPNLSEEEIKKALDSN